MGRIAVLNLFEHEHEHEHEYEHEHEKKLDQSRPTMTMHISSSCSHPTICSSTDLISS